MSYSQRIEQRLNQRYPGLREGRGLAWLDGLLCRLHSLGFRKAVRSFLSNMADAANLPGYLLEIELLDCLLAAGYPASKLRDEHCVPPCTRPIDVSVEDAPHRADFQCKFINSYHNELQVALFEVWVEQTFAAESPGAFFHVQATLEADTQTFDELRVWLLGKHRSMAYGPKNVFRDSRGRAIRISKHRSKTDGYFVGQVTSAIKDGEYAYKEDIPHARMAIEKRCLDALGTFAHPPSEHQQNFVVLDVDSLAMLSQRQVFFALYGQERMVQQQGHWVRQNDGAGLYASGTIDAVSAVLLLSNRNLGNYDIAVFPHPAQVAAVQPWLSRKGFRLGRSSRA